MTAAMIPALNAALEKFLASDDFKSSIIKVEKADWWCMPDPGRFVLLLTDETYHVLKLDQLSSFHGMHHIDFSLLDAADHAAYFGGDSGGDEDWLSTRVALVEDEDEDKVDAFLLQRFDQHAEDIKGDLRNKFEIIASHYDAAERRI